MDSWGPGCDTSYGNGDHWGMVNMKFMDHVTNVTMWWTGGTTLGLVDLGIRWQSYLVQLGTCDPYNVVPPVGIAKLGLT